MADPLVDALLPRDFGGESRWIVATVSGTSPLELTIMGVSGLPVSVVNASYTPSVSDQVLALQNDTDIAVICKVIGGG